MSIFIPQSIHCPVCGDGLVFEVVESVNADRHPDLKAAIVSGEFQSAVCPGCGEISRLEPDFTYLDVTANQWILAKPAADLVEWSGFERQATQALAVGFEVRVTFGWPALREKLLCADAGLDDVSLELLKAVLVVDSGPLALTEKLELRLLEVEADHLELGWVDAGTERLVEFMWVARTHLDAIVAVPDDWAGFREEISADPFVDVQRVTRPGPAAALAVA